MKDERWEFIVREAVRMRWCVLCCGLQGVHVFIEVEGVLASHMASFLHALSTKMPEFSPGFLPRWWVWLGGLKSRNKAVEEWGVGLYRALENFLHWEEQLSVVRWRWYDGSITVPDSPVGKPYTVCAAAGM